MQSDKTAELHACFKKSYDEVLRHHHSFIIRSVVSVSFAISWFDEIITLFIGLSALIVITLANLPYFHFIITYAFYPGIWVHTSYLYLVLGRTHHYSINRGLI